MPLPPFLKNLFKKRIGSTEINPDEIFIDSSNLPDFDVNQFEGRIEKPIQKKTLLYVAIFFLIIGVLYVSKVSFLQINQGQAYQTKSLNNTLRHTSIFAERGVIYDRNEKLLAWNAPNPTGDDFAIRHYATAEGFAHVLGYVKYPSKDSSGFYYNTAYQGMDGVEKFYDNVLAGTNGMKIVETDATGKVQSENVTEPPVQGGNLTLSIDSDLQEKLYGSIKALADSVGFGGGAGALMNIKTGEILALTSYPQYSPDLMSNGGDSATIKKLLTDPNTPFLDRFVDGLYTPGSIVKPYLALGALTEGVITPEKQILSTGSISLPNIYDPTKSTVFKDWQPQGWVDMRHAIAMSSDVYFYEIGGGYQDQKGLGISNIDKYMKIFGFGSKVQSPFLAGKSGTIPTPDWKKLNFNGEDWTIGDTYHTAIGQYGFQVSPMQMLVGYGTIANNGIVPTPTILKGDGTDLTSTWPSVPINKDYFTVVKEGMHLGAQIGTAKAMNFPELDIAAKTGTAELGSLKVYVNSWAVGFFPYSDPKYAFVVLMEHGPKTNLIGAPYVAREFLQWMAINHKEYL